MRPELTNATAPGLSPGLGMSLATGRRARMRAVAYWAVTLTIAWEMTAGSIWDLLQLEDVRGIVMHLGYPVYVLDIIGVWKFLCAATLLVPRWPRLKEWAYAGAFFTYSGAAASQLLAGDDAAVWIGPAGLAALTLASWAVRPPDRRLPDARPTARTPARAWIVCLGVLAALLVSAVLTLPVSPARP